MEPQFMEVLIFEVAGLRHGVPTADVQELLAAMAVMPVPGAPSVVEGVINLHGVIVLVVDARRSFGAQARPMELADHLIVMRANDRLLALHVDRAVGLATVDAGPAEVDTDRPVGSRVVKWGDDMVLLHRPSEFLAAEASP